MKIGMVDTVGNLDDAIALAAKLAGLDSAQAPRVVHLPQKQELLDSILGGDESPDDPVALAVNAAIYHQLQVRMRETLRFLATDSGNLVR